MTSVHPAATPPAVTPAVSPSAPARPESTEYRHDLDGLRGVAIALVVAFHVWFRRVSGGVDVFLVLSGFFFTGMLLRRAAATGAVGVWWTVRRTLRRLLPAMVVVLAAVAAGAVAIQPYTQWGDVADQIVSSLFYYQNWHLARAGTDYMAANPAVSPLQHLWSMSIQGQFYLAALLVVAAVVAAVAAAGRGNVKWTLGAILAAGAVASFIYAATAPPGQQAWMYYDSAARAWELLVGALLAVALPALAPMLRLPRAARAAAAVLGLLAVFTCGVLFNGAAEFPGPAALFPVGAAALLIVSGANLAPADRPLVNRILATKPATTLGELAYALYLWHWPVLILYLSDTEHPKVGWRGGLVVIAISAVAAALTQRFVERPLRRPGSARADAAPAAAVWQRRSVTVLVSLVGVAALVVALGWQQFVRANPPMPPGPLDPREYPGAAALLNHAPTPKARMRPTVFEGPVDLPMTTFQHCITPNREVLSCEYGDLRATRTIALVGSSHPENWLPAFELLGLQHHFKVVTYVKMGCPLTLVDLPSYAATAFPECRKWSEDVLDRLAARRPNWVFTMGTRQLLDDGDNTPPEFVDVWSALTRRGLNVMVMRDTPWLRRSGVYFRAVDCLARGGSGVSCGMPRSGAFGPVNPAAGPAGAFPRVFPLDLTDAFCGPTQCRSVVGNMLVYRDEHHITASYMRTIAPALGSRVGAITRWW